MSHPLQAPLPRLQEPASTSRSKSSLGCYPSSTTNQSSLDRRVDAAPASPGPPASRQQPNQPHAKGLSRACSGEDQGHELAIANRSSSIAGLEPLTAATAAATAAPWASEVQLHEVGGEGEGRGCLAEPCSSDAGHGQWYGRRCRSRNGARLKNLCAPKYSPTPLTSTPELTCPVMRHLVSVCFLGMVKQQLLQHHQKRTCLRSSPAWTSCPGGWYLGRAASPLGPLQSRSTQWDSPRATPLLLLEVLLAMAAASARAGWAAAPQWRLLACGGRRTRSCRSRVRHHRPPPRPPW